MLTQKHEMKIDNMGNNIKKVLFFNPLKKIMIRGISVYSGEYEQLLRDKNVEVIVYELPLWFGKMPKAMQVFGFMFAQQVLLPIRALKVKPDLIFDAYNTYSILAALKFNYIFVIHDFIPFNNKFWFLKPGALYQKILHNLSKNFSKLHLCYINSRIINDKNAIIKKKYFILPNIVRSLGYHKVSNVEIEYFIKAGRELDAICIVTISGSGKNKDFGGLVERLNNLNVPVYLVAFGFANNFCEEFNNVNVFSPGVVDSNLIGSVITNSDLFVFHSTSEGFGRPIIEALELKAKVICSDVSPSLDYINEEYLPNLYIYSLRDMNEFKYQFDKALRTPKRLIQSDSVLTYNDEDLFNEISRIIEA
ncbi:glycosyltransferase [Escherichia coli]|uniref:glycosyltransferase n=1 Tax=Escherichia coli TaxID=562 RepID=UPI0021CAB50D|nr:glycosyltransferase [Escherichia coli]MCU0036425.1 glycosyltransferase [Escherichia coli]